MDGGANSRRFRFCATRDDLERVSRGVSKVSDLERSILPTHSSTCPFVAFQSTLDTYPREPRDLVSICQTGNWKFPRWQAQAKRARGLQGVLFRTLRRRTVHHSVFSFEKARLEREIRENVTETSLERLGTISRERERERALASPSAFHHETQSDQIGGFKGNETFNTRVWQKRRHATPVVGDRLISEITLGLKAKQLATRPRETFSERAFQVWSFQSEPETDRERKRRSEN